MSSEMSLDQADLSLSSDTASALLFGGMMAGGSIGGGAATSKLEDIVMEMDRLGVEETRDLLISALFVLKHLDTRECLCFVDHVI